jgi:hypothetical protein
MQVCFVFHELGFERGNLVGCNTCILELLQLRGAGLISTESEEATYEHRKYIRG